jgi:Activator of Hsp90 ATPase homolog 1-like protein
MQNESYAREIIVNVSSEIAFQALTNEVDKWWGSVSNSVSKKGDKFTTSFEQDATHWTFRITDLIPNLAIDMECIEAVHIVESLPDAIREEWLGTRLQWRLEEVEEGTRISFTHEGLVAELACYEICVAGWNHFFVNSLQSYLNEGIKVHLD